MNSETTKGSEEFASKIKKSQEPKTINYLTLNELTDSGAHFGPKMSDVSPFMKEYVYDKDSNGNAIINLDITLKKMKSACEILDGIISKGGKVLMIASDPNIYSLIENAAKKTNSFYIIGRCTPGFLTNAKTTMKNIHSINTLKRELSFKSGLTKKSLRIKKRRLNYLLKTKGGLLGMNYDSLKAVIVFGEGANQAIIECKKSKILSIAVVDVNVDARFADIIIATNDDSKQSISVFSEKFAEIIQNSSKNHVVKENKVTITTSAQKTNYRPFHQNRNNNDNAHGARPHFAGAPKTPYQPS